MSARSIVEGLEAVEEGKIRMGDGVENSILGKDLRFVGSDKAFCESVVTAIAFATHALTPSAIGEALADALADALATAIGVEDGVGKDGDGGLLDGVDN